MDNAIISSTTAIKETFLEVEEDQKNKKNLQYENKIRKETEEKFQSIETTLQENVGIEKNIKEILAESNFNIHSITKAKYLCFLFIAAALVITFIISWKLNLIQFNFKLSFILIPLIFILMGIICYYALIFIWSKRIYINHINYCKNNTSVNKNLISLVSKLLDNQLIISNLLPHSFFKYYIKKHHKINLDKYISFLCKHSKPLIEKTKNKNLKVYQGRFSENLELLDKIKTIEAQYFSPMFRSPVADTIENCVKKFLRDEASIDSYING